MKSSSGSTVESVGIRLHGFDELMSNLEQLKLATQRKIARLAVSSGARIVRKEARRLVPVRTGNLRRSLTVKVLPFRGFNEVAARVFASRPGGSHAHLVEFGTKERYRKAKDGKKGGGGYTGRGPARPFLRPALDTKRAEIVAAYRKILGAGIEREFKKRALKAMGRG